MIKNVIINNFRQHEELQVDFSEGLSVIRGANEKGKTTILEAISFALFGVRACRNNDIRRWGSDKPALVSVWLELNGVNFSITRTTAGAMLEAFSNSQSIYKVTGSSDVTKKVEELLGVTAKYATSLMFAKQTEMSNLLTSEAKSAAMIEELANFTLIDEIIDKIQSSLQLGATSVLEQEVDLMEIDLAKAVEEFPEEMPSQAADLAAVAELKTSKVAVEFNLRQTEQAALAASEKFETIREANGIARRAQNAVRAAEADYRVAEARLQAAEKEAERTSDCNPDEIQKLNEELLALQKQQDWFDLLIRVQEHPLPKDSFPGREETLRMAISAQKLALETATGKLNKLNQERGAAQGKMIKDTVCNLCGQELHDKQRILDHNENVAERVGIIDMQIQGVQYEIDDHTRQLSRLDSIMKEPRITDRLTAEEQTLLNIDRSMVPPRVVIEGEDSSLPTLYEKLDKAYGEAKYKGSKLLVMKENLKHATAAKKALESAREHCNTAGKELNRRIHELAALTCPTEQAEQEALTHVNQLREDATRFFENLKELEKQIRTLEDKMTREQERWSYGRLTVEQTTKRLAAAKKRIAEQRENNDLLKRVRQAKPEITNKVWNTLLRAISKYFSTIRGQQSVVAKEDGGFVVDGHPVASLSESTLDILGLAIRVALSKTFLPSCDFILLDEPFAACDANRQAETLGFLTSVGFRQSVIITHEEATEALAAHVIEL